MVAIHKDMMFDYGPLGYLPKDVRFEHLMLTFIFVGVF
jgi:hypothetical protein